MASETSAFSHTTFCVVTGASRGLGQTISCRFAQRFPPGSLMLLLSRSSQGLEETKSTIEKLNPDITVVIKALDLGQQTEQSFKSLLENSVHKSGVDLSKYQQAMIVHNAASMGDISKKLTEFSDKDVLNRFWNDNLTGCIVLNAVFFQFFSAEVISKRFVIALTSLASLQPFKCWSLYCASKAARDMLFRGMAEEDPDIRVLSYAPGPLDTEMQRQVREECGDEELKKIFQDMKSEKKLLTCDESLNKLTKLLEENTFKSGSHIDYYDI